MRPRPGLVIHFDYLWRREYEAGRDNARYSRPCAVVLAILDDAGHGRMVVAPITHSPPEDPDQAVEIPPRVKAHLGLDERRSWIVTDDLNICAWPAIDVLPVPHGPRAGEAAYGMLPPALFERVKAQILAHPPSPTPRG